MGVPRLQLMHTLAMATGMLRLQLLTYYIDLFTVYSDCTTKNFSKTTQFFVQKSISNRTTSQCLSSHGCRITVQYIAYAIILLVLYIRIFQMHQYFANCQFSPSILDKMPPDPLGLGSFTSEVPKGVFFFKISPLPRRASLLQLRLGISKMTSLLWQLVYYVLHNSWLRGVLCVSIICADVCACACSCLPP